jgi:predicted RNA-binding protein with PIN domain
MFHIVIDGYNVIHASRDTDFDLTHLELEDARYALLGFLATHRRPAREKITVVFDGSSGIRPRISETRGIEVVFSEAGVTADEVICNMVAGAPNPRGILVVSDDREIRTNVLAFGAKVVASRNFLHQAEEESDKRRKAGPREPPEKFKGTPPGEVERWRKILGFDEEDEK